MPTLLWPAASEKREGGIVSAKVALSPDPKTSVAMGEEESVVVELTSREALVGTLPLTESALLFRSVSIAEDEAFRTAESYE